MSLFITMTQPIFSKLLIIGTLLCALPACEPAIQKSAQPKTSAVTTKESTATKAAAKKQTTSAETQPSENTPRPTGTFKYPSAKRIVAIGDLHGDIKATKKAFRLAGAIDARDSWVGGKLVIVQTGDQLDRGDGERDILEFLQRLQGEAKSAGGDLIILNGNHEAMNVLGDYRYVTPAALNSFETSSPHSPLAARVPPQLRSRARAFLPGGGTARLLAQRPLIAMVGSTVFVHGGVLPAHIDYGIERLNRESSEWMLGKRATPPAPVLDPEGPLWTRLYGPRHLDDKVCDILQTALSKLGAERLVVGHSVQEKGLSSACEDRVFRIDVGLSAYYGERPVQVLEIMGDETRILTDAP